MSCIETESLQPFIFIILGIWMQYWINFIIDQRNNKPKSKEKKTESSCKACWNKFKVILPTILLLWQITSMLINFYFDFTQLAEYHSNHKDNDAAALPKSYNCYAQVIIVSSNAKKSFSLGISFGAWLYTRCFLKHRKDYDDDKNTEDIDDIEMQSDNDRTDTANQQETNNWTFWDCINKPLKLVYWLLAFIYLIIFFPSFFTHGIVGMAVYCWIMLIVYGICLLISFIVYLFKKCCNNKWWDLIGGGGEYEALCIYLCDCCFRKKSWDPNKMDIEKHKKSLKGWNSPLSFTAALLGYTMVVLACSYWYSGNGYFEAIDRVITERKTGDYFESMVNSAVDIYKLFAAVF